MIRQSLTDAVKEAMKARDQRATSTLRMVQAKLKDKDIEARGLGNPDGIDDSAVLSVLQGDKTMDATMTSSSALLGLLPAVVFFLIFQRTLSRGITVGAVK